MPYKPAKHINALYREVYTGSTVAQVNEGDCYLWAYAFHKIYGGILCTIIHQRTGWHAFIKYGRKYYDSQSINGVVDWRHLRSLRWCKAAMFSHDVRFLKLSRRGFLRLWKFRPYGWLQFK